MASPPCAPTARPPAEYSAASQTCAGIATGQKTAVAAGKYVTRKLFVEVITDGQDYSATRVEYQVTRWLSILSSISTIGRTSANVRVSKDY